MTAPNESDLIHAFGSTGDSDTFERLVAPHQQQMVAVALSILHNQADAMDAVQDAVIRAFQNIDSLADTNKFGGWLMRIVFGCSIDMLRRRDSHTPESLAVMPDQPARSNQRPGDRIDAIEWSRQLCDAITSLPPRYRQPLTLFHLDGLSTRQVARHLDVPEGTARSLLTRARDRLGTMLPSDSKEVPNMANEIFQEHAQAGELLSQHAGAYLHVMNGDAAAGRLRASAIPDKMVVWTDILHEGPTPIDVSPDSWRKARSSHIASMGFGNADAIAKRMAEADSALSNPDDGRERVFWFEHDLYDQLLLIRHLHWLSQHDAHATRSVSLICIGDFPGIERFVGLGQLEPDQIASLLDTRMPIRREQIQLGGEVWKDYCAADPRRLTRWLSEDTSSLPYLREALLRHLQQFPSRFNGLGLTERYLLESLRDQSKTAAELFNEYQSRERAPFLGDAVVYHYLQRLASEPIPALRRTQNTVAVKADTEIAITDFGQRLLAGESDRVKQNGIDRWFGGVHVTGNGEVWRWDESSTNLQKI